MMFTFTVTKESETSVLAAALAGALPNQLSIGLIGTLGAGKTFFVRTVASFLDIDPTLVVSPTFTLCNEYQGDRKIFHFDFYRIQDEDELLELGIEETFESEAITFIEWADRFVGCLPDDYLRIEIVVNDGNSRTFRFVAQGDKSQAVVDSMAGKLNSPS